MESLFLKANYIRGLKLEAIAYADQTKAYPVYNDLSGHKVSEIELNTYLEIATNEGENSEAWWKIRSILGQEA
ncbi:hypothetical protein A7312_04440 [Paenibacillus polymyxa]|nr:hypothetical protein A7312_04440 [Paenibacillus polymyxa]